MVIVLAIIVVMMIIAAAAAAAAVPSADADVHRGADVVDAVVGDLDVSVWRSRGAALRCV